MLRKSCEQQAGLMADLGSRPLSSPTDKYARPTPSFFNSPRLFTGFSSKGCSDSESGMSPTSILDNKPFSGIGNPFWYDKTPKSVETRIENRNPYAKIEPGGVGLGIIEALDESHDKKFSKRDSRMVLFGSHFKIQIPAISPTESLESPRDFGIKTSNSLSSSFSPRFSSSSGQKTPTGSGDGALSSPRIFTGSLSVSEMELSEDYTCVISHGPNPKTTHIFDNCIVETCVGCRKSETEKCYPSDSFLSFCYACKKNLGEGKDIYMYRGDKAFCSRECRYQEMLFEEDMEKSAADSSVTQFDDLFDIVETCS
ncbi:FCS-Like Zinc finger 8-like [Aristolochia californica]|uniref:FCS-Like Zinc finger 8-like n=1 Tax=Aristolochia californica TaxID=171875 RepID=UPI0035D894AA